VLRESLRRQLPRSPLQQMVSSDVIMHSTLARLLKLPPGRSAATLTAQLTHAAQEMSNHLCGTEVRLPRVRRGPSFFGRSRASHASSATWPTPWSWPTAVARPSHPSLALNPPSPQEVERLRDAGVERSRGCCAWVSADEGCPGLGWVGLDGQLWFVEEEDLLALALRGQFHVHPVELACEGGAT